MPYPYDDDACGRTDAHRPTLVRQPAGDTSSHAPLRDIPDDEETEAAPQPAGFSRRTQHALVVAVAALSVCVCLLVAALVTGSRPAAAPAEKAAPAGESSVTYEPMKNAKLWVDDLAGDDWASALSALASRGADTDGMVVKTEDGKRVILPSNWTVKDIAIDADGVVHVTLAHTDDLGEMAGNVVQEAGSQIGSLWERLKEGFESATAQQQH